MRRCASSGCAATGGDAGEWGRDAELPKWAGRSPYCPLAGLPNVHILLKKKVHMHMTWVVSTGTLGHQNLFFFSLASLVSASGDDTTARLKPCQSGRYTVRPCLDQG
jgi:hypothetical protein